MHQTRLKHLLIYYPVIVFLFLGQFKTAQYSVPLLSKETCKLQRQEVFNELVPSVLNHVVPFGGASNEARPIQFAPFSACPSS